MMDLGSVQGDSSCHIEPGAIKFKSRQMAQNSEYPLTILQESVSDVDERSSPYASAWSARDEWLKGLEGR